MDAKHSRALQQAVTWIKANYNPTAIILCGSLANGKGNTSSDLDLFVVHKDDYKQRVQLFFDDIPCEIFINNLQHIQQYFERELKNNRPVTATMLANGKVLYGEEDNTIQALTEQAKLYATKALILSEEQLNMRCYALVTLLEDACDILDDEASAKLILNKVIEQGIELFFLQKQKPLPRVKVRIPTLLQIDKEAGELVSAALKANSAILMYESAEKLVLKLTGHNGFYTWQSGKHQ